MIIDCDTCAVRDVACGDCVMSVLLGPRTDSVELDSAEQTAIGALIGGGLLPPLRLVRTLTSGPSSSSTPGTAPPHRSAIA